MEIKIYHPKTVMVIEKEVGSESVFIHADGSLAAFTNINRIANFIELKGLAGAQPSLGLSWNEAVDKFGNKAQTCTIDHDGKPGFHTVVPLVKDQV